MPVILEGSVVSGEITGLDVRRPKACPQFVHDLLCDLEQSAEPLWSQDSLTGVIIRAFPAFCLSGIFKLESKACA